MLLLVLVPTYTQCVRLVYFKLSVQTRQWKKCWKTCLTVVTLFLWLSIRDWSNYLLIFRPTIVHRVDCVHPQQETRQNKEDKEETIRNHMWENNNYGSDLCSMIVTLHHVFAWNCKCSTKQIICRLHFVLAHYKININGSLFFALLCECTR